MKIFITGATGFIGRHLVNKLADDGHLITINLYGDEESPFEHTIKTFKLNEKNSKRDIAYLKEEKYDGIIHLASLFLKDHQSDQVTKLIDSNVRFSSYILECTSKAGINWFINTGTFWQHYQNGEYSPVNLYAASKQAFESIAQYYIEIEQIKFVTLRLSDTFGPNDTRPKVFNLWQNIARTGETLEMSAGDQVIDISYIDDIVNAYRILADHLQNNTESIVNGSVFAVNANIRYTLKELASIFEQSTGSKLNINWGGRKYGEREVMEPWTGGILVPGWRQQVSIEEGIKSIKKKIHL
jgi:CDP-paratose synthetase